LVTTLTAHARDQGLTDTAWASRAGLRKETLSRLRNRATCDFATLESLAAAVGSRVDLHRGTAPDLTSDGHFPANVDRELEQKLVCLCAHGETEPDAWRRLGPAFFMAGLAVMCAGSPGHDRSVLLHLAERLHPGASEPSVFARWLERSPVRPTRFLPALAAHSRLGRAAHAA
jgi:hypothetical protein